MRITAIKWIETSCLLVFTLVAAAQNVGIGTNAPLQKLHVNGSTFISDKLSIGIDSGRATFDVKGTVLFRGEHNNAFTPVSTTAVEFATGHPTYIPGAPDVAIGDIAFSYGGPGGGYRHFISTSHNPEQGNNNYNSISFYINNSYSATGSQKPGIGNQLAMTLTNTGLAIGSGLPQAKLYVNGHTLLSGKTQVGNITNNTIGYATAHFEVSGAAMFKGGNNYLPTYYPRAGVEFVFGRNAIGVLVNGYQNPDIAFNYGDQYGGFRHYITTRHENASNTAGNAFDFYVNNVSDREGSYEPGAGNKLALSITGAGIGIGKSNPAKPIDIAGDGEISGEFFAKKAVRTDTLLSVNRLNILTNTRVGGKLSVSDTLFATIIAQESVQPAALQNGWVNHGGGFADAGYWKDREGVVHLQGLIRSGTTDLSTVLFTLPPAYRPSARHIFMVLSNNSPTRIDVLGNGDVLLSNTASNQWLSLSGIYFRAN